LTKKYPSRLKLKWGEGETLLFKEAFKRGNIGRDRLIKGKKNRDFKGKYSP